MNRNEFNELMDQLIRINNQLTAVRRTQSLDLDGETCHPSEMQVLLYLSEKPMATVSDVASHSFFTISAASQIIKKLAAKGLIIKKRNLMNERVVNLSLSEEGAGLVDQFKQAEAESMDDFYSNFSDINENDFRISRGFLLKLEQSLKQKLKDQS
ncbi:MAG: MarR family transcriptional regulator [Spirochaetales bacterium]|nr:MarR family transcriptional regulator [Spirochaetales bacterium]